MAPNISDGKCFIALLQAVEDLAFIRAVRKAASRISGKEPGSLGLHPVVYFYGATGRFQPTAFLAAVAFVRELDAGNAFVKFTSARQRFEEFLLRFRHFINQVGRNYGSGTRGVNAVLVMYRIILAAISSGKDDAAILQELKAQPQLRFLREITEEDKKYGRNFSVETKTAAFLRDAMDKELRCAICGARMHFKSISVDHAVRKEDGGLGDPDNAQLTHLYCNTGYKESEHAKSLTAR